MTSPGRLPQRLAPLTVGLALWAGLPSLEWCPFTWDDCRASCETTEAAVACAAQDREAASACETERAPLLPCDPDPDPVPLGDRAWCIHAPIDGVPARGIELAAVDAGPILAEIVEMVRVQPAPAGVSERRDNTVTCPALHAPHAPPQSRAPPQA